MVHLEFYRGEGRVSMLVESLIYRTRQRYRQVEVFLAQWRFEPGGD